jgi:hypothetical protein
VFFDILPTYERTRVLQGADTCPVFALKERLKNPPTFFNCPPKKSARIGQRHVYLNAQAASAGSAPK